jgi:hypothetical protein
MFEEYSPNDFSNLIRGLARNIAKQKGYEIDEEALDRISLIPDEYAKKGTIGADDVELKRMLEDIIEIAGSVSSGGVVRKSGATQESAGAARRRTNFASQFNLIRLAGPVSGKISLPFFRNVCYLPRILHPQEGRLAIASDVGSGRRWTAWCATTKRAGADERKRVVLISRCWDQVCR